MVPVEEPEAEPPEGGKKGRKNAKADKPAKPAKPKKPKMRKVTVEQFPRLTTIATFDTIAARDVVLSDLNLNYDRETGFLGTAVRTGETLFKCSSLDKILLVWPDGRYKVVAQPDRIFVDKNLLLACVFDRDRPYTVVYTENSYGFTYLKRFSFGGTIMNRDYSLLPEPGEIRLLVEGTPERLYVKYKPAKGQRIHQQLFRPSDVGVKGVRARGNQMTAKPIQRLVAGAEDERPRWWDADGAAENGQIV